MSLSSMFISLVFAALLLSGHVSILRNALSILRDFPLLTMLIIQDICGTFALSKEDHCQAALHNVADPSL
jgi:hypothetical protein